MDLTRRALIGRAAAASGALLGGRALMPGLVFAGEDGEAVFEVRVPRFGRFADGWRKTPDGWCSGPIRASRAFELLGVEQIGSEAAIEVRAFGADGRWTEWLDARPAHGHGPDGSDGPDRPDRLRGTATGRRRALTDPVWTGRSRAFEMRAQRPLPGARVLLVDSGAPATAAAAKRFVDAGLPAGAGQPPIIARSTWATAACRPRVPAVFGAIDLAFVHHTVNSNAYRPSQSAGMVRSICLFHKYGNGWNDIGYNFVVDRYGQIFEARAGGIDEAIVGAQAGGYNVYSSGVALLGNFAGGGPPRKTFDALAQLLAWKLAIHGIQLPGAITVTVTRAGAPYSRYRAGARVRLNRVSGHRDADSTSCPGAGMYRQLPRLRQAIRRLAGTVSSLSLQIQASGPGSVTLGGVLSAGGAPIAGATVEVQRRSTTRGPSSLGAVITDANGAWSQTVPLGTNAELRALYRGDSAHAAVVSPGALAVVPAQVALAAATQQASPGGVIEFTGSTSPAKPLVSIVIAQQQPDGTFATVRTIRLVPADDGSFARTIGFPDPGQYQVFATTAPDRANGLGAAAGVAISIA